MDLPKTHKEGKDSYFTIGWVFLRDLVKESLENNGRVSGFKIAHNAQSVKRDTCEVSTWQGYSADQLRRWVTEGYRTDILDGISDAKPIREKRRYLYVEEGEEMHIDRALSGEDNYMSEWSKREVIPGAAVEAEVMFSAGTKAEIVNAYNVWLCRAISSLEAAGIDCQLTLKFSSENCFDGAGAGHTIVKVKSENEDLDFTSFSAILSPAALRTFGFCALTLHAESAGKPVSGTMGRGRYNVRPTPDWNVSFNSKRQVLEIDCPYQPKEFPAGRMDSLLQKAILEMK